MSLTNTTRIQEDGRRVLRLAGELDVPASRALADQLVHEPLQSLVLDFYSVARIDDRGLADLAEVLRARPLVSLCGLRDHQLRLLAYLGVDSARRGGGSTSS